MDRTASRRSYAVTVAVGLAAAAATGVGVARPWVTATADVAGLPQITASVDGADISPLAAALSFVLLAGFGAVVATRGWVRRALGVLIAGCAGVILLAALFAGSSTDLLESSLSAHGWSGGDYDRQLALWRWVVVVAAALCLLAGSAVARYGGRWATMGARYDPPSGQQRVEADDSWSEADVWKAIDTGHDPTQTS
jgi:uncharacterized membrane protein (TIGR02234 family)